jgi:N-acetylneuraminic acid mutarotase
MALADATTDALACVGSREQPTPRGDAVGAIDPTTGMFYVFGGDTGPTVRCVPSPVFSAETWRYDPRCDRWDLLSTPVAPSPRSRAAWALDTRRRRLLVFGGRYREGSSGAYTLLQDVWAFDLATERWEELTPKGERPAARANASAIYDPERDALVLFGGNTSTSGLSFTPRNDVWALDLGNVTWRRIATTGTAPSTRLFHAAARVGRAMWVYGGGGANAFMGPFYSDLWRFDLDTNAWSRVMLTGATDSLGGRINAALVPSGEGAVLIAGHDDGALGNRNDVLTVASSGEVAVAQEGDTLNRPGAGFCDFPADFATTDEDAPERRSAFVYAVDPMRNRVLLFGGKTDCGSAGDVWSLDLADHRWRPLRMTNDGLSCQRSGRQNCRSLCN